MILKIVEMKKGINYILFDFDGVIIDSELIATKAVLEVLKPTGYKIDIHTYSQQFAGMMENEVFEIIKNQMNIDDIQPYKQQYKALFWEKYDKELKSISGMDELIKNLNISKSIVSNSNLDYMIKSVKKIGLENQFDRLFSAQMVEKPKPFPDLYNHAVDELNLDRSKTIVIEDSPTGVRAAKSAGLNVIGFLGAGHIFEGHEKILTDNRADYIAKNAYELKNIILELNNY